MIPQQDSTSYNFSTFAFEPFFFLQGHTVSLVEVVKNELGLSSHPVSFRRALCAQEDLPFNIKTPKLWRENIFSVPAAPISPAKIHLVTFLFLKVLEAPLRWKAAPSLCLPFCSPRSCFLLRASRNERENSCYGRASRVLDSCSWAPVDPSSHLTPIHKCTGTYFYCFSLSPYEDSSPPLYSSVHTFASYYFSSECVGRIH